MVNNEIWIDIKTVAEIKGITSRAIRLSFPKGKYVYREIKQQGGKSYEILLSSLEPRVQDIYKQTYYREIIEAVNHDLMVPVTKSVETETGFIPETAKAIALARVDLVLDWQKFRDKYNPKHKGDELFLDLYNSGEYLKSVFAVIGKTSRGSLQRWHKSYSEHETWEVLVPQYSYRSFREYRTILSEEEIGVFLKLLLHPNQFSMQELSLQKNI